MIIDFQLSLSQALAASGDALQPNNCRGYLWAALVAMAVPEDIALAAHRGDVDTVRGFLDQHPESVDQPDVIDDLEAPMNLMQIAVRLAIEPDTRGKTRDLIELLLSLRAAQLTSTSTRLTPWQKYCLLLPKELLRLRSLVARGRARERRRLRSKTPREISLLFARSFPNELFWKVLAFWNPRH